MLIINKLIRVLTHGKVKQSGESYLKVRHFGTLGN